MIAAVVIVLHALILAGLALAFRPAPVTPHPNGATLGGVKFTEWPERA